jgi:hypothetical protein
MSAGWTDWLEAQAVTATPATPFASKGPPRLFWIASGAVDLFLVHRSNDGARGARHAIARFGKGEIFLAADVPELLPAWEALFVPLPDTRLVELDNDRPVGTMHAEMFGAAVEHWLGSLIRAADRGLVAARYRTLEPNEPLDVASGEVVAAAGRIVWVELVTGELAPFDDARFAREGGCAAAASSGILGNRNGQFAACRSSVFDFVPGRARAACARGVARFAAEPVCRQRRQRGRWR